MRAHLRICLAVGAALAVADAHAAEVTTERVPSPRESPRALNGHVFQPSRLLTGPFTTTSFGMATLFGAGEVEAPRFDLQGNQIGTRKYAVAAYGQALDLDLRVTPDISVRFDVNGLLFSGLDARGILVAGATAQYGLRAGLTAGRDLGATTRLSLVADFGLEPEFSVLVANAVRRAIDTGEFDDVGLFSKVRRLRGAPGVSFAWAPSAVLGLVAEARYVWTRRISSGDEVDSDTAQGVSLGGLASLDLDPLVRFPIAIQGSYRADLPVGGDGINEVHQVGLGVFYSRRVRLALGLEVLWRHGDIRAGVEPTLSSDSAIAAISLRYYW
jgi:hypothetical protein